MGKKDNDGGNGYVLIHRQLMTDKELWLNGEPFTKGQAWIDLILLMQHSEYRGTSRGSYHTSQVWLANRWGWTRAKVQRFLEQLIEQGNITTNSTTHGTTVTLVNYEKYQNGRATDSTTNSTTKRATNRAQTKNVITKNDETKDQDRPPEILRLEEKGWGKFE